MDIKSVKVDSKRGERGDWVDNIPGMGDLRLRVRSYANSDYQAFLSKEIAAVPREKRVEGRVGGALLPQVRDDMITRGIVEHILLGWENLSEGGEPIPYSKEKATEFMVDPDYRDLRDAVNWAATDVERIREDEVNNATGNS